MAEILGNVILFFTNAGIAITQFLEPFTKAYVDYYKDAFATGNLIVIAFAFLLNILAFWQIGSFFKWLLSLRKSKAY